MLQPITGEPRGLQRDQVLQARALPSPAEGRQSVSLIRYPDVNNTTDRIFLLIPYSTLLGLSLDLFVPSYSLHFSRQYEAHEATPASYLPRL